MWQTILSHTPLLYLTQSLWRDEVFSVLAAQQSPLFIIKNLGFEPPVYYLLLSLWTSLFGTSEIAVRSLSLVGFVGANILMLEWGWQMYKKHWLSWFLPLMFFLNPMLLYYAFETRTYAWYTFFATATLYTYVNKQWKWFITAAVLGFYTHTYHLFFVGTLALHYVWTQRHTLQTAYKKFFKDRATHAFLWFGLAASPWIAKAASEATRLKSSWYYPVDWHLIKSVIGNMFLGYEGTPWYGWKYTYYLSIVLIGLFIYALKNKKTRTLTGLFALYGFLPLSAIIAISFVKPLFVNRYLIPVTISEVLLVGAALANIRNNTVQKLTAAAVFLFVMWFNWWYPPQHPKADFRTTFTQVKSIMQTQDVIVASDPIIYFESLYYAPDPSKVYLYNPTNEPFPWYIGDALFDTKRNVLTYPDYPYRAIVIHPDTTYEIIYRVSL